MPKSALVIGIAGQDGSYLAELLLSHGYQVHGLCRPNSNAGLERIQHLRQRITMHAVDFCVQREAESLIERIRPTEVYNLASQSSVALSWEQPEMTTEITGLGAVRVLESIRRVDSSIRFCQASSSEIFGNPRLSPQTEMTPIQPLNPYGAAKALAHFVTGQYRAYRGLFACSCILYNHESPRRGAQFVTRKITQAVARIKLGLDSQLSLGNLNACRDWGYAADHVRAMWLALQPNTPDDYVIGTGVTHTVQQFVERAFMFVGLDWRNFVVHDAGLVRPADPGKLVADFSKARTRLGWEPTVPFSQLVEMMVQSDLARAQALANDNPAVQREFSKKAA